MDARLFRTPIAIHNLPMSADAMKLATHCRMCGSERLARFLDLGSTPPADRFLFERQLAEPEESYPLRVVMCRQCGLAQLDGVVSPVKLYCEDYPYESSTTRAGQEHWHEFAATVAAMMNLSPVDLVIDIGSNVGVLLQMFKSHGARVLGVDPAANIAKIASDNGIETIPTFFNSKTAQAIAAAKGRASVITGTNVFAHIDDLHDLLKAVDHLLNDRGIFIIEMPYFSELLHNLEYDTIYHEHLSYLSLVPLTKFFERFGMSIFDAQRRDIHGGSIRVFVCRKGASARPIADVVNHLVEAERREKIHDMQTLAAFADAVAKNRSDLRALLIALKADGKRIAGVSAPAKGMTLLNYCGIGRDFLDFVTEKSKLKIGRYTPGTRIKVVPDEMLLQEQPDFALLLAWNFAGEIMNNLKEFANRGGKFIVPIPTPRIVG